jgi:hypothetical protein
MFTMTGPSIIKPSGTQPSGGALKNPSLSPGSQTLVGRFNRLFRLYADRVPALSWLTRALQWDQNNVFLCPDTHFVVYMNAEDTNPSMELHSREALAPVFADLNQYDATTHFVG